MVYPCLLTPANLINPLKERMMTAGCTGGSTEDVRKRNVLRKISGWSQQHIRITMTYRTDNLRQAMKKERFSNYRV